MKKDNRGFLLAESLVVSTFVLTVLILLFIQFSNLTTNYKNSYNYNNVESIYDLSSVASYLQTNNYNLASNLTTSKPYVIVFQDGSCNMDAGIVDSFCDNLINKMDAKTVIYTYSDINVIQNYVSSKEDSNINQKLRDFISRVETGVIQNKGRLFAEFNNGTFATIGMDNELHVPETPVTPENPTLNVGGQNIPIVTESDGLYADTYESGRYIYKGANPNNYITFNNETWRIVSIESDKSLKIINSNSVGSMPWDNVNARAWNTPATLNTYLNGTYLSTLANQDIIASHNWSVGSIDVSSNDLSSMIAAENNVNFNGKIGLITPSEYIRANTNVTECGTAALTNTNYSQCTSTNWMTSIMNDAWTISYMNASFNPIYINSGFKSETDITVNKNVVPAVYLNNSITLSGSGTQADPYKIG